MEVLPPRLVVHRPVERGDDRRRERLGDVADAEADDLRLGVGGLVGGDSVGDLREKVGGLDLRIVLVDVQHGGPLPVLFLFLSNQWCEWW